MNIQTEWPSQEGVLQCPNGCDFDEIEIGKENESFHALIELPFMYIRCGKCLFHEEGREAPTIKREEAIENWNGAVRTALQKGEDNG